MKYFKITRTFAVKAESEEEAMRLIAEKPDAYLDAETISRTEYKKPHRTSGWGQTLKDQVFGTQGNRSR